MNAKTLPISIILPILITLTPLAASSEGVEGAKTTANIVVRSATTWTTLSESKVVIPAGQTWHCIVSGSADAINSASTNSRGNQYRFVLSLDTVNPGIDGPCERSIEFENNLAIDDVGIQDINSTCPFKNIASGTHIFRWQARKVESNDFNLTVPDNSHTVMCSRNLQ